MPANVATNVRFRAVIALLALLFGVLSTAQGQQTFHRWYKATAYLTIFGIPIYSRSNIGYGWAAQQTRFTRNAQIVDLQFMGGSFPEHAHGLNRFGYIQESVQERADTAISAEYFGVMTTSREETLGDAKSALGSQGTGEMPYVAAAAQIDGNTARCSIRHLVMPEPRKSATGELTRLARASFGMAPVVSSDSDKSLSSVPTDTFLYTLRNAMLSESPTTRDRFLYNAKMQTLTTEKHADKKVEAEMHRLSLLTGNAPVLRLTGVIENEMTGERTTFSVWYQKGSPSILPLRFEFKPKSYLKLVFEAQAPHQSAPELASIETPDDIR